MKKLTIITLVLMALMAAGASAYVDVTYSFSEQNVEVAAYNRLNSDGSSVGAFSGSFPNGQTTTNGQLTVRFPNSLSQYGYALYYFSPGFVPKENLATWHSNGYGDAFSVNVDFPDFRKLDSCRAVIDSFTITNEAYAHVPIVINMNASLDASVKSAFGLTDNELRYVPTAYRDEYYSSDVQVTLRIYNSGNFLVHQEMQAYTIFADGSQAVQFTWMPLQDGQFRAEVRTDVVDSQCSSSIPGISQKQFTVLDTLPRDEYYTIMNSLTALPTVPTVGEEVTVSYTKISNYANDAVFGSAGYTLTPTQTAVTTTVRAPSGVLVSQTETLAANSNAVDPRTFQFDFTPTEPGLHTVTLTGKAVLLTSAHSSKPNPSDTVTLEVMVEAEPTYTVSFQIFDGIAGTPIGGVVMNMDGKLKATDSNGQVSFDGLEPGTYGYVATHPNYLTASSSVIVTDSDKTVTFAMQPGQGVTITIPTTTQPKVAVKEKFGFHVSTIRIPDAYDQAAGNEVPFYVTFSNDGDGDMNHVKATVVIQELAVRANAGPFQLDEGEEHSETLFITLPDGVAAGVYPVRITLHSDEASKVLYREVELLE